MRLVTVLAALAVLIAAPAAYAKEITRVRACGADGCVTTRDTAILNGLTDGGPPTVPPSPQGGVIRLRSAVSDGHRTVAHFTSWWVPSLRLLVAEDGTWMRLPASSTAALNRLTRGLEPLPASTLGLSTPSSPTPAPARIADAGGTSWLLIALAVAAVLAAALLVLRRLPKARMGSDAASRGA